MDIGDAVDYPTRGEPVKQILALTVASIFSFLVLPMFYLNGYLVAVIRGTINNEETPPVVTTDTIGQYLKDGFVATGVFLVYTIPMFVIGVAGFGTPITMEGEVPGEPSTLLTGGLIVLLLGLFTAFFFFTLVYYPAAIGVYVKSGSIGGAFAIPTILGTIFNTSYILAVIIASVIGGVGFILSFLFSIIPFIGFVIAPLIVAPISIFNSRVYGLGVAESLT